ncbi:branched-chain amino acid ABC transporter substrate-binding protein [Marinospirillum minutulum]|uniref:branched-chain amino acid ABC transporter substrate-binding protein n=1 Tax=Marinospirillum minutulum TaxID=64974 RepID=UPI000408E04E|nr:branched-chain amino acid ABC transporter substrate-binding protein [Marinospirillum minutulum]
MKKTFQATLLSAAAASLLLGSSLASAASTIKIALAGPVSGPVAQYGDMQFTGAQMAIKRINAQGGVNGKMLEGVVYDDACEPRQAVTVANRIVNDNISFVVGHLCSGSTQPASAVYDEEGILMITAASTSPEITQLGYRTIFRTIGLDNMQGPVAGNYIATKVKPKKMAILHDKQQYGEGIARAVNQTVTDKGINVVMFDGINAGDRDFSAIISRMVREDVDFVYYGGYHPELGLLLRQSSEQGLDAQFMGPEGVGNPDITAIAGEASEGLLVTLPPAFEQDPRNADLVKAFRDNKEDPAGPFVMPAYTAVQLMAEGMKGTKSENPEKVAAYLRANSFDTPIGQVQYDDKGDLKAFNFVVFTWHADATRTEAP